MSIADATRQAVRERASYLCEYCHSPERLSANRFTIDHVSPRSLEGSDDINNLALACRRCNARCHSRFTPDVGYSDHFGTLVSALAIVAAHIKPEHKIKAQEKLKVWFS